MKPSTASDPAPGYKKYPEQAGHPAQAPEQVQKHQRPAVSGAPGAAPAARRINATEVERKTFEEGRDGMKRGWAGTLDYLVAYLARDPANVKTGSEK